MGSNKTDIGASNPVSWTDGVELCIVLLKVQNDSGFPVFPTIMLYILIQKEETDIVYSDLFQQYLKVKINIGNSSFPGI